MLRTIDGMLKNSNEFLASLIINEKMEAKIINVKNN